MLTSNLVFSAFQVAPAGQLYEEEFLSLMASVNACWDDPAGRNVVQVARSNHLPIHPVIGFKEFPGEGIGGAVQTGPGFFRAVVIGELKFLNLCGLQAPELLEVARRRWEAEGAVVTFGGWDGWIRGIMKFMPEE